MAKWLRNPFANTSPEKIFAIFWQQKKLVHAPFNNKPAKRVFCLVKLVNGDIGIRQTAKRVVDPAILTFGRIDLLVNCARAFIPKPFPEYPDEDSLASR